MTDPKVPEEHFRDYSRRLANAVGKTKRKGNVGNTDREIRSEIEARQKLHRDRVERAIKEGHFWPIIREEFARDLSAIADNLTSFGIDLDGRFNIQATKPKNEKH